MIRTEQVANEAIAMAVKAHIEGTRNITDVSAFSAATGKRVASAYRGELLRAAGEDPELTAEELFWLVIAPTEFSWMTVDNPVAKALLASGARDRARKVTYGPYAEPRPVAVDLTEQLAQMREQCKLGGDRLAMRDRRPPEPVVTDLTVVPPELRQALDAGIRLGAENRKARRERAMSGGGA